MKRIFDITMQVPLGIRHGILYFTTSDSKISGVLHAFGKDNEFSGELTAQGNIDFSGEITSRLLTFRYCAKGQIIDHKLSLKVTGGRYSFSITGEERLSEQTDTEKRKGEDS